MHLHNNPLNPEGIVVQDKTKTSSRYSWTRSNKFKIRSMLSGRFYKNKIAVRNGDGAFRNFHINGNKHGVMLDPKKGILNLPTLTAGERKLRMYMSQQAIAENPLISIKLSDIALQVHENPMFMPTILDIMRETEREEYDLHRRRNGIIVVQEKICQRVPVGEEHLVEGTGVRVAECK